MVILHLFVAFSQFLFLRTLRGSHSCQEFVGFYLAQFRARLMCVWSRPNIWSSCMTLFKPPIPLRVWWLIIDEKKNTLPRAVIFLHPSTLASCFLLPPSSISISDCKPSLIAPGASLQPLQASLVVFPSCTPSSRPRMPPPRA